MSIDAVRDPDAPRRPGERLATYAAFLFLCLFAVYSAFPFFWTLLTSTRISRMWVS